jgi:LysR family transcriptional activator of nhaA
LSLSQEFRLMVRCDRHERLMADLQAHQLDLVLAHEPAPASSQFKGASYALGESGVSFLAAGDLHRRLTGRFPISLDGAPLYLPGAETTLRRAIDDWFAQVKVRPAVCGEFADSSLLNIFGQGATAIFPCLTLVEKQVMQQCRARVIGRTQDVRERFFAIASSKRLAHPGVTAICRQPRLLAELVDGMPVSDIGMLKEIAKRLRRRRAR